MSLRCSLTSSGYPWPPKSNSLVLSYRVTSGSASIYLNLIIQVYAPSQPLCSSKELWLTSPPLHKRQSQSRLPYFVVPLRWNGHQDVIRGALLTIFKNLLKTHLSKRTSCPNHFNTLSFVSSIYYASWVHFFTWHNSYILENILDMLCSHKGNFLTMQMFQMFSACFLRSTHYLFRKKQLPLIFLFWASLSSFSGNNLHGKDYSALFSQTIPQPISVAC